jgi:hypothetical protein
MTQIQSAPFFLLMLYMALKPFYLLPSGLPQLADIVLVAAILLVFAAVPVVLTREYRAIAFSSFAFACYTLVVNTGWALVTESYGMIVYGVFYSFNALAVYLILRLAVFDCTKTVDFVTIGVVLGALIQAVYIPLFGEATPGGRETGAFNNPNQLGYYGLLCASLIALLSNVTQVSRLALGLGVGASIVLTLFSLSKAAMISTAMLLLLHFFRKPSQVVILVLVAILAAGLSEEATLLDNARSRLENIGAQKDDSAEGRGYARIVNYPEHLAFGAGESGYSRFPDIYGELHSTLGTVLFSYGLVGLFLFGRFVLRILFASSLRYFVYCFPAFLYGVTHQGLRFTPLWVLLTLIAVVYAARASKLGNCVTFANAEAARGR